jgi:hypothetical protein
VKYLLLTLAVLLAACAGLACSSSTGATAAQTFLLSGQITSTDLPPPYTVAYLTGFITAPSATGAITIVLHASDGSFSSGVSPGGSIELSPPF